MRTGTAGNVVAAGTFVVLVGVAYAGADHPPPPGFVIVVALAGVCAWLVRWLVPVLVRRSLWLGAAAGATFGLSCALLLILIGPRQESVVPALILCMVLAAGGALGGLSVAVAARVLIGDRPDSDARR